MESVKPHVWIVGAGPGDPDLISVKAMKVLQQADVILYDALLSRALLLYAAPTCKLVYVGKRSGYSEFDQQEINQLMVFYAMRYGCVVRLKGGDPYVFGRGHEELEYVHQRGIEATVIPGISSALAAPACAGIPLTKRGVNESFWVITGTLSNGRVSNDLIWASKSTATIIVLMGMKQLAIIVDMISNARSVYEPIAIIQNATCAEQKMVLGNCQTILNQVAEAQMGSPAVIVIGNVVNEHEVNQVVMQCTSPAYGLACRDATKELNW